MKVVLLHGAPVAGKPSVGKSLLTLRSGRTLDNHAAIDFALTIFAFGAPGFWELIHDVRLAALGAAARAFYDALIVAAAIEAGCDILVSEDMQEGRVFGELTIRNPFRRV